MWKCIKKHERNAKFNVSANWTYPQDKLEEAYKRCAVITEDFAKTFYLGTQLMAPEKARAVWAIYVWCRRTDELVDGPNADRITPQVRSPAPRWSHLQLGTRELCSQRNLQSGSWHALYLRVGPARLRRESARERVRLPRAEPRAFCAPH